MEKKEQERLEEILAMCAQYEEQIDSEMQLNATIQSAGGNVTPYCNGSSAPPEVAAASLLQSNTQFSLAAPAVTQSDCGTAAGNRMITSMPSTSIPGTQITLPLASVEFSGKASFYCSKKVE